MFVVVKKGKVILVAVLCVALVTAVTVGCVVGVQSREASAQKLLPVYSVQTDADKVALTFDAAWGSDKTRSILDILDTYQVQATFFLVGFWIDANEELTQEIASRGHLIGNHSKDHPRFSSIGAAEMQEQVEAVNTQIERLTGTRPKYFRPPFGDYNNTLIGTLDDVGMTGVQWDVDSLDWKGIGAAQITERILSRVHKGSIILCHNNSDHIAEALPTIIMGVRNKGLSFVRIDELVLTENYQIDNNGTQTKST